MKLISLRWLSDPSPAGPGRDLHARPRPACRIALLGWRTSEVPVDAGVPVDVVHVISRALCRLGMVTFLHSPKHLDMQKTDSWHGASGGYECLLKASPLDKLRGYPDFLLLCTSEPSLVERLFDQTAFQWVLRSQVVFVSPHSIPPQSLQHSDIVLALEGRDADLSSTFRKKGITSMLLPGVDGDYVECVVFDNSAWIDLQERLKEECLVAGGDWGTLDGDNEFNDYLAGG